MSDRAPLTFSRIALYVVLVALGATLIVEFVIAESQRRTTSLQAQLNRDFLQLERSLGYTGFIHNFKNYVLRPGEDAYLQAAREDMVLAQAALVDLEATANSLDLTVDFKSLRDTLEGYEDVLDVAEASRLRGDSITETDRQVRISDDLASLSLRAIQRENLRIIDERVEVAEFNQWIVRIVFLVLLGLVAILIFVIATEKRRRALLVEQEEKLKRERAQSAELATLVQELKRSNRDLDDFAYIASHDLKEPLRGILINGEFLLQEKLVDTTKKRVIRMTELAEKMEALMSELLEFSRLGRVREALSECSPEAVIEDIKTDIGEFLSERHATIDAPSPMPRLSFEYPKLKVVFQNIIINAIKYNKSTNPFVRIYFQNYFRYGDKILKDVFVFEDNGIGIEERHRDKVFRIFSRLNKDSDFDVGTGSGLAFVRRIVEDHDGWVDFYPRSEGGTYFLVHLPRADTKTD